MIDDLNQIRFKLRSGQTKDFTFGMTCFSAKQAVSRGYHTLQGDNSRYSGVRVEKTGWPAIRIIYMKGEKCLTAICFSELARYKFN